jgi:hypothetical protein
MNLDLASFAPLANPALQAVRRARAWCEAQGRENEFRTFEAFVLRTSDARTYEELARDLAVPVHEVRAQVARVRERIREELRLLMQGAVKP